MDNFTLNDLGMLVAEHEEFCLSIYLPTFEMEDKTKQNPVLLRNIIKKAFENLIKTGVSQNHAKLITEKIEAISYDTEFWLHSSSSLCVFAAEEEFYVYRLPLRVKESIYVSKYYYLLPLFELLDNKDYYLITVDEAGVRFYLGKRLGLTDLTSEELRAKSISDIRAILDVEEIQSFRTENNRKRAKKHEDIIYHGHGNEKDDKKIRINQFIKSTLDLLPKVLSEDKTPVILAGNQELVAYFKIAYPYHNVYKNDLIGDTQRIKLNELHKRSWELFEETIDEEKESAKSKYQNLKESDLISNNIEDIIPAAFYGKIDTLLVDTERQEYGRFNSENDKLVINRPKKSGDDELVNLAAIKTFQNSGEVVLLNTGRMADKTLLNAIFRY